MDFNRTFVSTEQVKIYFNLKPSINMNLLPSLKDGHLYSASFDILQDMFLRFSDILGFALTTELTIMVSAHTGPMLLSSRAIVKQ